MGSQKIVCPNCDHQFAWGDAQVSEEQKAIYVLHQHGYSIRSIGRMFNLAPESIRYRIKELNRNKYVAPQERKEGEVVWVKLDGDLQTRLGRR
jgi:hypothetical protein